MSADQRVDRARALLAEHHQPVAMDRGQLWRLLARFQRATAELADVVGETRSELCVTGAGLDDGTEPYCTTCGQWAGMFLGMEGWHHFRGDPSPGGRRTLFDAGHQAVIGWRRPPGLALSPAAHAVVGQALADAITCRDPAGFCPDCETSEAGLCADHAEDLDRTDAYLAVARDLGIEVDRG